MALFYSSLGKKSLLLLFCLDRYLPFVFFAMLDAPKESNHGISSGVNQNHKRHREHGVTKHSPFCLLVGDERSEPVLRFRRTSVTEANGKPRRTDSRGKKIPNPTKGKRQKEVFRCAQGHFSCFGGSRGGRKMTEWWDNTTCDNAQIRKFASS
mmetsp:Transcript_40502/g.105076  ORF Transcript_40502/g.105076 Transcript_40502/m.105076 type:complete len:153 (+) Transcript_40502:6609-7067(+)